METSLMPPPPARPDVPTVSWRWWEAIPIFLIGSVLAGLAAAPAIAIVHSNKLEDLTLALAGEFGIGGTTFLWLWLWHRRSMGQIGVPERPGREIGVGVLGGVGLYLGGVFVVGAIVVSILHQASHHVVHSPRQIPNHLSAGQLVLAGITVLIAAPIAEELLFRGFLFRALRAKHRFVFAGIVSALCFGAVHYSGGAWQNALLLPIVMTFVGFGLAWLYERRGNIVANMAAHATFNVIGFIFIVTLNT
ncbi:MAG: lysostaphin resistance A-like protein [Actinomycetota bacterium]